jgi:hypothetical protein
MAKMAMPKNEEASPPAGQKKPLLLRFWVQVDRQTKNSFETMEEAEKTARAIKSAHPNLQVGVYDSVKSAQSLFT